MVNSQTASTLEEAIMRTLAYFDVFDFPLTTMEVWRWLYMPDAQGPVSFSSVDTTLRESAYVQSCVEFVQGYWCIRGRSHIIGIRQSHYRVSLKHYRKAQRFARLFHYIPYVRMMAVCNKLGYWNNAPKSDIDLFFIVARGRLWLARLMITILTQLLGVRRHGGAIANRFCLSFYTTTDRLSIADIAKHPSDPYFTYWTAQLFPLFGVGWHAQWHAANSWMKHFLPNVIQTTPNASPVSYPRALKAQRMFERLIDGTLGRTLESWSRVWQIRHIKSHLGSRLWDNSTDVIANDTMLKFHETDKRDFFRKQFEERCKQVLSPMFEGSRNG
ncbi:MAG: hypothetical protein V1685_06380, partial [Parcubacteria group bacterium]